MQNMQNTSEVSDVETTYSDSEKKPLRTQSYFKKLKSILLEHKLYFIGMCFVFFISLIFGYFLSYSDPEYIIPILENFENLADFENATSFELFITIFWNNASIASLLVLLGFFAGIISLILIFINGAAIGAAFEYVLRDEHIIFFLIGVVPHGILEIPSILLAGAVGFRLGIRTLLLFFRKVSFSDLKKDFLNSLWILFLFIIPMLLVAAFIEVYITKSLLELFFEVVF